MEYVNSGQAFIIIVSISFGVLWFVRLSQIGRILPKPGTTSLAHRDRIPQREFEEREYTTSHSFLLNNGQILDNLIKGRNRNRLTPKDYLEADRDYKGKNFIQYNTTKFDIKQ